MKTQTAISLALGIIVISTAFAGASLRDRPQKADGAKHNVHKTHPVGDYNLVRSQKNSSFGNEKPKAKDITANTRRALLSPLTRFFISLIGIADYLPFRS